MLCQLYGSFWLDAVSTPPTLHYVILLSIGAAVRIFPIQATSGSLFRLHRP